MIFINLLMTKCSHHIETSQLICRANQLTGFFMMGTLVVKRLRVSRKVRDILLDCSRKVGKSKKALE